MLLTYFTVPLVRMFLNFTLAILLLIAFIGSAVFFISVSNGLKLERSGQEKVEAEGGE